MDDSITYTKWYMVDDLFILHAVSDLKMCWAVWWLGLITDGTVKYSSQFLEFLFKFSMNLEHCKIRRRCVQSQKVHVVVKFCCQSVQR